MHCPTWLGILFLGEYYDLYGFSPQVFANLTFHAISRSLRGPTTRFILHEVKRASEASEASLSEMLEILRSLQLCMSFPSHIGKKKNFLPPSGTGVIRKCLCVCVSVHLSVCVSVAAKKRNNF